MQEAKNSKVKRRKMGRQDEINGKGWDNWSFIT
ncbi:hypothetical protein PC122_g18954 [Phytophthora cactorum]|nr:hypothetical protein PC122_g18954 [Phytophthora cactorum]